jgi:inner membrane protein
MFIGHAPSGYIISSLLLRRFISCGITVRQFLFAGIFGAIAPDIDMFYFYLVDHRQHHHHTYFTHFPVLWIALLVFSVAWLRLSRSGKGAVLSFIFCLGGSIHMVLDSVVGDIGWLAPFVDHPFAMFTVPALYTPWWLNFLLHWSFAVELILVGWALAIHRKRSVNRHSKI